MKKVILGLATVSALAYAEVNVQPYFGLDAVFGIPKVSYSDFYNETDPTKPISKDVDNQTLGLRLKAGAKLDKWHLSANLYYEQYMQEDNIYNPIDSNKNDDFYTGNAKSITLGFEALRQFAVSDAFQVFVGAGAGFGKMDFGSSFDTSVTYGKVKAGAFVGISEGDELEIGLEYVMKNYDNINSIDEKTINAYIGINFVTAK